MKSLISTVVLLAAITGLTGDSIAELPPGAYERLRSGAPEVLHVRIISKKVGVAAQGNDAWVSNGLDPVYYTAEVTAVARSKAFLLTGDKIVIESYKLPATSIGFVGPRMPPELDLGREYRAFLKLGSLTTQTDQLNHFKLAAFGASFEPLPVSTSDDRESVNRFVVPNFLELSDILK